MRQECIYGVMCGWIIRSCDKYAGLTYVVQFVVESAGVANGFSILISPPEGCRRRLAVCAAGARPSRRAL